MGFSRKNKDNNNMQANHSAISKLNMDELDMKSHLNDSLELKGISVSEDLIQKTLEAVRQNEAAGDNQDRILVGHQKEDKKISKKLVPWNRYIRIAAGTAAAVFVVAAGLNFYNGIGKKDTNHMDTGTPISNESSASTGSANDTDAKNHSTSDSITYGAKSDDNALKDIQSDVKQDKNSDKDDTLADQKKNTNDSKANAANDIGDTSDDNNKASSADKSDADDKVYTRIQRSDETSDHSEASDKTGNSAEENETGTVEKNSKADADTSADKNIASKKPGTATLLISPYLTFQEIAIAAPEAVQNITITDEINKTTITITDKEAIKNFYNVMDQQKFLGGSAPASAINYTIKAISIHDQKEIYTMKIGESITISTVNGNVIYENTYQAVDQKQLINNLGSFYLQNSR